MNLAIKEAQKRKKSVALEKEETGKLKKGRKPLLKTKGGGAGQEVLSGKATKRGILGNV